MSIRGTLYAATGAYSPSGAYSIEVLDRPEDPEDVPTISLGEHFFVIGPSRIVRGYSFLVSARPTFNGASVTDFGAGLGVLQVSGKIHAYHTGPVVQGNGNGQIGRAGAEVSGQALLQEALTATGLNAKSGYHDFFDLLWLVNDSRSEGGFNQLKPTKSANPDPAANGAYSIFAAAQGREYKRLDFENTVLVWNDYDKAEKLEVAFADSMPFTINEDVIENGVHTWSWQLNFKVLRNLSEERPAFRPMIPDVGRSVSNALQVLDEISLTVQGAMQSVTGIVQIAEDLRNLKTNLSAVLAGFREGSSAIISNARNTLQGIREKSATVEEAVNRFYFPGAPIATGQLDPSFDASDLAEDPLMLEVRALGEVADELEASFVGVSNREESEGQAIVLMPPGVESWEGAAAHFLNDVTRGPELRQINGTRTPGRRIRIPGETNLLVESNIVTQHRRGTPPSASEILFGTDLALRDGDIFADASGDIAAVSGVDCLVENLLDRLSRTQGTVPMHPEWGARPDLPSVPDDFLSGIAARRIVDNLYQDRGVQSIDFKSSRINGDAVELAMSVTPVGGFESEEIEFMQPRRRP